jgi:hypothetical protein
MKYETRVTKLTVAPEKEPLFSEQATHIEITDEAAGEFVKVTQCSADPQAGEVLITSEEWPSVRDAIERLLKDCRDNK